MPFASDILFPVDFSSSSETVLPAVAAMARRLGVPLTLVHATTERGDTKLQAFGSGDTLAGLTVRREVLIGPPAAAIVERAARFVAPLIMMPTRGTSAFRQLLLGSVTASVLHDAACPVWTSAHCLDGGPLPREYRSIVCAVDLGPQTAKVLKAASEFAGLFGAELHVVHSVQGIDPRFESAAANRAHAFLVNTARDEYPALAAALDNKPELEVVEETSLVAGINGAISRHRADALVIGRGVSQGVLGRLRTNAHDLIRQSPCPVLSV